jgi:hypothetical protein
MTKPGTPRPHPGDLLAHVSTEYVIIAGAGLNPATDEAIARGDLRHVVPWGVDRGIPLRRALSKGRTYTRPVPKRVSARAAHRQAVAARRAGAC